MQLFRFYDNHIIKRSGVKRTSRRLFDYFRNGRMSSDKNRIRQGIRGVNII